MIHDTPPSSDIILYQTEDGRTRINVRFAGDTLWLTQSALAELFQTTPQNITLHIQAMYSDGELEEAATCKEYLHVRQEGTRTWGHQGQTASRHDRPMVKESLTVQLRGTSQTHRAPTTEAIP